VKIVAVTTLAAGALVLAAPAEPVALTGPQQAICVTFKQYCYQALRVSWCESRWSVWARNGDYLGLFQVSSYWRRAVPGFAFNAWAQARHAYRVFVATGRNWRPWQCRP
jgi:hypothetical protein